MNPDRLRRYYLIRLKRLRGSPRDLALGFALGVFVGLTPTMPLHTILIFLLTYISRSSFIAGMISSWLVCNPLTFAPIYYFSLRIGNVITPYQLDWKGIRVALDQMQEANNFFGAADIITGLGMEAILVLLIGGVVMALPFTVASFYGSLRFFRAIDLKRRNKHVLD